MYRRLKAMLIAILAAFILLQPATASAKKRTVKVDVEKILKALAGSGGTDGVQLVKYYAANPEQLRCLCYPITQVG